MKFLIQNKNILISSVFALIGIMLALGAEPYFLYVATSWLIFGILGLSLDLVWGKAGILSLGQTIFYGLGGYGGAIVAINFSSVFGNTLLLAIPAGILIGALLSGIIGAIMFYGRMGQLQVTILTYTLTLIVWTFSVSFSYKIGDAVIGGDNGMSNIPEMILSFGKEAAGLNEHEMFFSVLVIAIASLAFCQYLMKTPFGKVIECIRLDIQKTELLGYNVRKYQTIIFTIAGALSGLAGALFALWGNYLNPNIFSVNEALLVPIYVLVGGIGSLIGPFLGAIGVGALSFYLGGFEGGQATLVIGVILILMVLFFDKGLTGIVGNILRFISKAEENKEKPLSIDVGAYEDFAKTPPKILKTENAYKSFGGVVPVNDISLEFGSGKVSCIIGPNGAGKSSYLRVCAGVYDAEKGNVYLGDHNVTHWQLARRVHEGLGIKMQKPQVFTTFSIRENIWIAAYSRCQSKNSADQITDNMLKILGGKEQGEKMVSTLSHGEQQWLDIVMVLSLSPSVILFDEPAAGMTKDERKELSGLIVKLSKYKTIILVEHDMDFVKSLDPNVTVLHQGKVFASGSIEEMHKDERILDIYLGRK
ncbi:MAG: ATP-binding cassette domain-containing protein [Sulfurospirillaceae bacterium]|nr:ATP-binding cassette domain-containing protein [Sulfurospirillaceae bacterium]